MNFILFDDKSWKSLLPLTFTRPVAEVRIGILTIKEKWEKMLGATCSYRTQKYLSEKFLLITAKDNTFINGSVIPNNALIKQICDLKTGQALVHNSALIAARVDEKEAASFCYDKFSHYEIQNLSAPFSAVCHPWDIFKNNGEAIDADFNLLTKERKSAKLSRTNNCLGAENIFLEEGVKVECAILNGTSGKIYVGAHAEIMEGSIVRGPFALGEHSTLKLGAKIYGPTTIGPCCKVGGEVNNSVIFGYSNKAHDGFLGNSVIGEWCNIGADSNNSNLKNNYAEVKLWSYEKEAFVKTGLQFCGLIMGDHSKCGINTMFNTGTVVGVSANIFGSGFPRNFIPSFSWGGAAGFTIYSLQKAFETAELVLTRRDKKFDDIEKKILTEIFEMSDKFRNLYNLNGH